MPQTFLVTESNNVQFSTIAGAVSPVGAFSVVGLARAGSASAGIGTWFQGTYGDLWLNVDGSFTYRLNNLDPDTNVLALDQTGEERFTFTYLSAGVTRTDTITFRVGGIDEPGQQRTISSATIEFAVDTTLDPLQHIVLNGVQFGLLARPTTLDHNLLVNNGSVQVNGIDNNWTTAVINWDRPLDVINNGRIEVAAGASGFGSNGVLGRSLVNNGVIRAVSNPTTFSFEPQTYGAGVGHLVNNGVIEAISDQGEAFGVGAGQYTENNGLIYVRGGSDEHVRGITGIQAQQSTGLVVTNSGTILVESNGNTVDTIGISAFRDSPGIHTFMTIDNSGTIVADIAVFAFTTSASSGVTAIHMSNTGRIEGALVFDVGQNIVVNGTGATWIGALDFGIDGDTLLNGGFIRGDILLNAGNDLFDGRGGSVDGLVDGGVGADVIFGGVLADRLSGGDGADRLNGGGGADQLTGGLGADIFSYTGVADSSGGSVDTITDFQAGIDRIDLSALAPNGIQLAATGGETTVTATTSTGTLTIRVLGTISQADIVSAAPTQLVTGTAGGDNLLALLPGSELRGSGGDDVLMSSLGDDILNGETGADFMRGGAGNDTYIIDDAGDRHIELAGEGVDQVLTSVDYSLHAFVENATLTGTGAVSVRGNALANILIGNDAFNSLAGAEGDDILIGGNGVDFLSGGDGVDTFVYRLVSDSREDGMDAITGFETGIDKIDLTAFSVSSITWVEFSNPGMPLENHSLVTVETDDGAMTIKVYGDVTMSDFLADAPGVQIVGTSGSDTLQGGFGDDTIDGRAGADFMRGMAGDDIYFVDNSGDVVTEVAGEGFDRIFAAVSYALGGGSQIEKITTVDNFATTAINLAGNALSQQIYGNAGSNRLDGGGGGDVLVGLEGDDFFVVRSIADRVLETAGGGSDRVFAAVSFTLEAGSHVEKLTTIDNLATNAVNLTGNALAQFLYGNAGANLLDGKGGGDVMVGLEGDDHYYVRNVSDRVLESAGGGFDRVFAATSFTLEAGSQVEKITTLDSSATTAINHTGNALAQQIYGNAGSNRLDGGGGGDVLVGLEGDDVFIVRSAADRVLEAAGGGSDRILAAASFTLEAGSHVEKVSTIDNLASSAINLTGNALAQFLYGNAGANLLDGKGGADVLIGLGGADSFAFTTALGGGNIDRITDYGTADDVVLLDDAVFTGLGLGALGANAFVIGTSAADADDRIIYDAATGALFFDADGSGVGAAVQFATLAPGLAMTASEFMVI